MCCIFLAGDRKHLKERQQQFRCQKLSSYVTYLRHRNTFIYKREKLQRNAWDRKLLRRIFGPINDKGNTL